MSTSTALATRSVDNSSNTCQVRANKAEVDDSVYLRVTLTSVCSPAKEALTAGRAVHLPLRTIAADDVKQLLAHLVAALAELHRHYGHDLTGCRKATDG